MSGKFISFESLKSLFFHIVKSFYNVFQVWEEKYLGQPWKGMALMVPVRSASCGVGDFMAVPWLLEPGWWVS